MKQTNYFTSQEAARLLGVRPATLYAYVSRGLIRSEAVASEAAGRRARRYRAEDVLRLKDRREQRRDPSRGAERALHWGDPVLESGITLIAGGRLYYRGHDALELAASRTAEEVAALIWTGNLLGGPSVLLAERRASSRALRPAVNRAAILAGSAGFAAAFQAILPLAAAEDLAAHDLRPAAVARAGARILRLLASVAAGEVLRPGEGIAAALARAWAPADRRDTARRLIDAALVLCADHELNVSSFTARCVASAGATPYAVVSGGLAALTGVKHGGHTERVEALLREAGAKRGGPRAVLAARLKSGEALPGFGHALYPEGDPRGAELMRLAAEAYPRSPAVAVAQKVAAHAWDLLGERPNLDFGLAALAGAMRLPAGGALALFALGRTIGWIGHALEQYQVGQLIRPRARYVGPPPQQVNG